jgi:hypothetical protein
MNHAVRRASGSAAEPPQFTLRTLLSCVAVIAAALASYTQFGAYSASVLPMFATLLIALASGGSWKDGMLLTLYVYGIAVCGIVLLLAMTVLAVAIGVWIG